MADLTVASCIYPLRFLPGVTVERREVAAVIKGVQHKNPPQTLTFVGHIQQASSQATMRLAEGDRTKDAIEVFSKSQLMAANVQAGTLADRVVFNGRRYEVIEVDDHTPTDEYYRALALKVGQ